MTTEPRPFTLNVLATALLGLGMTAVILSAQVTVLDWRDPGWTNLATGGPSEFLTNSSSNGSGWEATHRLSDVGGSGIDVTFTISHQPNGWNIENRPALGAYFASPNGIDGDILRAWNSNSNIPAGELPYYTMEFSQPVTVARFGVEGMRRDDAWQIQAYDWAGNLVEPNWSDPNVTVETMAGDPLQEKPINLLRGVLTEAESSGRYDAAAKAYVIWNKNNVNPRAAAVVNYNDVVVKKMVFTMIEVDPATGISVGTPSDTSIYLAGGFQFDATPTGTNPLPHCFLASDDGLRLTSYNHDTKIETDIGDLGVDDIEAIEFDPVSGKLYGARHESLYEINTDTGAATVVGPWSPSSMPTPFGALDAMSFDDVDGFARNVASNEWYASARVDDFVEGGGPDLLFKFSTTTGNYIPGAFPSGHDYVRIEKPSAGLNLIDDLSYDSFSGKLYGIANGSGAFDGETTIVEIDTSTGNTIDLGNVVHDPDGAGPSPAVNVGDAEGLTITLDRRVLMTTGKDGNFPETLFELHGLGGGGTIAAVKLTDLGFGLYTDYEAITCAVFINPAEVGGTVFEDFDSDGSLGSGDLGIGGVDVHLKDGLTDGLVASTVTDSDGGYQFGGLPYGSYNVVVADSNFQASSTLEGRTPTADPEGDQDNQAGFVAPPLPVQGFAQSLRFDGDDDYVGNTNSGSNGFKMTKGPFTMTAWVKPGVTNQIGGIVATASGESIASQVIYQTGNRFVFQYENLADLLITQTKISPGFWYHLAAVYDGSNLKFYVNGILEAEKTTTQTPSNTNRIKIGKARTFLGEIHFAGDVDAVSYWETALSINQIQSLTQFGVTGSEPGLNGYWDWDTGGGTESAWDYGNEVNNLHFNGGAIRQNVSPLTALNFGYSAGSKPETYAAWQTIFSSVNGGANQPTDNADGDIYNNLLEYALCLHPGTGVYGPGGFLIEGTATNVDAVFWRRAGGLADVTYKIEGRDSLPIVDTELWNVLVSIPGQGTMPSGVTVTDLGNGIEQVRVSNIGNLNPLTPTVGFARMTIDLDDGTLSDSAYTQVFGWRETTINQNETGTYGNALTKIALVSGAVEAVTGTHVINVTIAAGKHQLETILDTANASYYLEVTSGNLEGHRFDITDALNDTLTLAIDDNVVSGPPYNTHLTTSAVPSALVGGTFLVREHYTIDEYFPPQAPFVASTSLSETSDQVYLFTPGGWQVYWLYDDVSGDRWVENGDLSFQDAGSHVIAPGEGLFVNPMSDDLTMFAVGTVRKNIFQQPLAAGYNLVASGFPIDQSASMRAMTPLAFDGDPDPELADRFYVWNGDGPEYEASYGCYFLLENAGDETPRWVHVDDDFLSPADFDTTLFRADRSNYIFRASADKTDYFSPLTWCIGLIGE